MTIKARLISSGGGEELHYEVNEYSKSRGVIEKGKVLMTMNPSHTHGLFKTATLTAANTVIVVQPRAGLAIAITDIILSGEKQAASSITIQFTDGGNTEVIIISDQVDSTPVGPGALNSYFRGWKDARVEMVTSGAGDATCTIGYIHMTTARSFAEWDAER